MRINPSDILFLILSTALLLMAALTLGGLAAHPFAGRPLSAPAHLTACPEGVAGTPSPERFARASAAGLER